LEPDSPQIAELKALTRDQDALIQGQTRLVNQLTACLKAYYPVALHLFSKLQQRSALVFLQTYPTPQAAASASLAEIEATLKKGGHTTPGKVAPKVLATLHQPHAATLTASRLAPKRGSPWRWSSSSCLWSNRLLSTIRPSLTFF